MKNLRDHMIASKYLNQRHPMTRISQILLYGATAAALVLGVSATADAEEKFPNRPVTITISVVPGGGVDATARRLSKALSEMWGYPVIVQNSAGAGGIVAATAVAKGPADGHHLFMAHNGDITSTPFLFNRPDYQPLKQLAPITQILSQPYAAVVHPSVPARNMVELIAHIKEKNAAGQKFGYATGALGSADHLAGEKFRLMSGVDLLIVPYKSSAPAVADVAAGHVPFGFFSLATTGGLANSGAVRMLSISSQSRSDLFPNVPTVAETLPGFTAAAWYGLFGPAGMSKELIERIYRDMRKAMSSTEMKEQLQANGQSPVLSTPAAFGEFLRIDSARTSEYIKQAGINPQ